MSSLIQPPLPGSSNIIGYDHTLSYVAGSIGDAMQQFSTNLAYGPASIGHDGFEFVKSITLLSSGTAGTWHTNGIVGGNVFFSELTKKYYLVCQGTDASNVVTFGFAQSDDLLTWTYDTTPFFQVSTTTTDPDYTSISNPHIWKEGGTFYMFYGASRYNSVLTTTTYSICLATSTDLVTWARQGSVVTGSGLAANGITKPFVVKRGSKYFMFAECVDGTSVKSIGHAESTNLTQWSLSNTAVLAAGTGWDSVGVGSPVVYNKGDTWYMLYAGTATTATNVGIAFTNNEAFPAGWQRVGTTPVITHGAAGSIDENGISPASMIINGAVGVLLNAASATNTSVVRGANVFGSTDTFAFTVTGSSVTVTTGTSLSYQTSIFPFAIKNVLATVLTASSSGNVVIDIKQNGVSIFSTPLTIDASTTSSKLSASPYALNNIAGFASSDIITIDVTSAGTGATGLNVYITGQRL